MLRRSLWRWASDSKVTAWKGPRALDLPAFERRLRKHGVQLTSFSPAGAASPFVAAVKPPATAATAPVSHAAAQFPAAAASSNACGSTKTQEVIVFTLRPGETAAEATPDSPVDSISPFALVGAEDRSFFFFADGTVVGWRATWPEIVHMWCVACPGTDTTALTQSGTALVETFRISPSPSPATSPTDSQQTADVELTADLAISSPASSGGSSAQPLFSSQLDDFVLANDSETAKLPFSYALAQSVRTEAILMDLAPLSERIKSWRRELLRSGTVQCNIKELRRTKTQLLGLSESVNGCRMVVHMSPKIFWHRDLQDMRSTYREACAFLEVEERLQHVQSNIDIVEEALSYLHDEAHASSGEYLTWVIIVLIFIEIVVVLELHRYLLEWLAAAVSHPTKVGEGAR